MISALPRPRPGARGTNPDLDVILADYGHSPQSRVLALR